MPAITRRAMLLAAAQLAAISVCESWLVGAKAFAATEDPFAGLEAGGRLGVAALNLANGATIAHRADQRFPLCSTFKVLAASAILQRSSSDHALLQKRIVYSKADLVPYSPITSRHAGDGMTVAELCAAALQYSDNTAGNLMLRLLGGPSALTSFARSIGDDAFRLDRWETALNEAAPGDPRDTSTPAAMMNDLRALLVGDVLAASQREQLVAWMRGNTTGSKRIRAGVPTRWIVADKTGSGQYGTTNDIAMIWPPGRPPITLAIYFTQRERNASPRDDVIATTARIATQTFSAG